MRRNKESCFTGLEKRVHYTSSRKHKPLLRVIAFVFFSLFLLDIYEKLSVYKDVNAVLKHTKKTQIVCGEVKDYNYIYGNRREYFAIQDIFFSTDIPILKMHVKDLNQQKQIKLKVEYIKSFGRHIIIRIWQIDVCR